MSRRIGFSKFLVNLADNNITIKNEDNMRKCLLCITASMALVSIFVACSGNKNSESNKINDTGVVMENDSTLRVSAQGEIINKDSIDSFKTDSVKTLAEPDKYDIILDKFEKTIAKFKAAAKKWTANYDNMSEWQKVDKYSTQCDRYENQLSKIKKKLSPVQRKKFESLKKKYWAIVNDTWYFT